MRHARIYPWRRTRRFRAPSNGPEAFFVAQFSADYTTNMFGFDLRQGQLPLLGLSVPSRYYRFKSVVRRVGAIDVRVGSNAPMTEGPVLAQSRYLLTCPSPLSATTGSCGATMAPPRRCISRGRDAGEKCESCRTRDD